MVSISPNQPSNTPCCTIAFHIFTTAPRFTAHTRTYVSRVFATKRAS
jgi:hypothetical protein